METLKAPSSAPVGRAGSATLPPALDEARAALAGRLEEPLHVEKVGSACYRLAGRERTCIVKISTVPAAGAGRRPWHRFFGGSLGFQNEARLLRWFLRERPEAFRVPTILSPQGDDWFAVEPASGSRWGGVRGGTDQGASRLGQAIYHLGTLPRPPAFPPLKRLAWAAVRSPGYRTIQMICSNVRRQLGVGAMLRSLLLVLRLAVIRPLRERRRPGLVHNDLHGNNILVGDAGQIVLIDWEDAAWTNRWWLVNLIDSCWDGYTAKLDARVVRSFMAALATQETPPSEAVLRTQVRFALMRRLAQVLNLKKTTAEARERRRHRYRSIVLSNRGFDAWWAAHRDAFTPPI